MSLCSQVSCKATLQLQGEPAVGIPPPVQPQGEPVVEVKKEPGDQPPVRCKSSIQLILYSVIHQIFLVYCL